MTPELLGRFAERDWHVGLGERFADPLTLRDLGQTNCVFE